MTSPAVQPLTAPIGLIGLPDLVGPCSGVGLTAVHDVHAPTAVATIQSALAAAGPFPVLVAESATAQVGPWLDQLRASTHVLVLSPYPGPALDAAGAPTVTLTLPATLDAVLTAAGYSGLDEAAAHVLVGLDYACSDLPAGSDPAPQPVHTEQGQPADPVDVDQLPDPVAHDVAPVEIPADAPDTEPAPRVAEAPADDVPSGAALTTAAPHPTPTGGADQVEGYVNDLNGHGTVVVAWSGKGGVGKTTAAFAVAQRAAKLGLRVALIDAGPGDLRVTLRAGSAALPSVYQAASSGNPETAFVDAERLNASRPIKLERLEFAVVQAPPAHVPDPTLVTPQTYREVIAHARRNYDLVVLDTHTLGPVDHSGMLTGVILPLLRTPRSHGIALTDSSAAGVAHLLNRLKVLHHHGVPAHTQYAVLNRVPLSQDADIPGISGALAAATTYLGSVTADDEIASHLNRGRPISDLPSLLPLLDQALTLATGHEPAAAQDTASPATGRSAEPATEPPASSSVFVNLLRRKK